MSLGAVAMLLSLLMEPALQALITNHGKLDLVPGAKMATISRSNRFDNGSQSLARQVCKLRPSKSGLECVQVSCSQLTGIDDRAGHDVFRSMPDFPLVAAFNNGLGSSDVGPIQDISFTCQTGNCTWPTFLSLAVCSSCHDVSHLIRVSHFDNKAPDYLYQPGEAGNPLFRAPVTEYSLPPTSLHINNDDMMLGHETYLTAVTQRNPNSTINFQNSQTLLATFTLMRAHPDYISGKARWNESIPVATECGLTLCLNAYNSTVVSGQVTELVVGSTSQRANASWQAIPTGNASDQTVPGSLSWNPVYTAYHVARYDFQLDLVKMNAAWFSAGETFNVSQKALDSTSEFLSSTMPLVLSDVPLCLWNDTGSLNYSSSYLQPLWESNNVTQTFEMVARSLTNYIRKNGDEPARGTTDGWVYYFKIRWQFISLPLLVVASK